MNHYKPSAEIKKLARELKIKYERPSQRAEALHDFIHHKKLLAHNQR